MKIVVSTHQGTLYNEEIDYFTVHKTDGDFGVMKFVEFIFKLNENC